MGQVQNFEAVFRFNPVPMVLARNDGPLVVECTEGFTQTFGFSRAEIVGSSLAVLAVWEEPPVIEGIVARVLAGRTPEGGELRLRTKEGRDFWGVCRFSTVPGEPEAFLLVTIEDITPLKSLEQTYSRHQMILGNIFDNSPSPIYAKDLDGRYLALNAAGAQAIGGYTVDQALGKLQSELVKGFPLEQMETTDRQVAGTGMTLEYEQTFVVDGRNHVLLARKAPLRDLDGQVVGVIGVSQDITELKDLHALLDGQRAALERQNTEKNRLFTILAHDMRGPIGTMGVLLGLALDQLTAAGGDEAIREILDESHKASLQTYNLLENLLGWVSGQMDDQGAQKIWTSVANVFNGVSSWLGAQAKAKDLTLQISCPPSLVTWNNERVIETIVRNLTANALKYSPPGSMVLLAGRDQGSEVWLEVVDQGVGMAPEKLAKLFGDQKVDSSQGTGGERGNGLGLMFCADMARTEGGRLEAESTPGQGSTFRLVLPKSSVEDLG